MLVFYVVSPSPYTYISGRWPLRRAGRIHHCVYRQMWNTCFLNIAKEKVFFFRLEGLLEAADPC